MQAKRIEQSQGHEYPVSVAGINLTLMLYDIFQVGKNIDSLFLSSSSSSSTSSSSTSLSSPNSSNISSSSTSSNTASITTNTSSSNNSSNINNSNSLTLNSKGKNNFLIIKDYIYIIYSILIFLFFIKYSIQSII